jgi:DNA-binding NarL/FixJ family response regulator
MTYRIVVVAGENQALRALTEQLGDNVQVKMIESANEALWEVRSDPPEVIIADLDLSEMSGLEMAEILPNFDVPTKIVIWSRSENPTAEKEAKEFGVSAFLSGSISVSDIQAAINQAVQEYGITAKQLEEQEEMIEEPDPEPEPVPIPAPARTPARAPAPRVPVQERSSSQPERATLRARRPSPSPRGGGTPSRGSGSLAARAAAAEHRSAERLESTEHEREHTHTRRRSSSNNMVLTSANLNLIRSIMSQLSQELGPQCILLTDRAGMVLVDVGATERLPVMILLPLLSTSFATSGEVSRQLGEEDATTLYIHEGVNYDLYCFDIAQSFLFVLVFNKKVASSKIGAVWVNTKRAIRELQDALLS